MIRGVVFESFAKTTDKDKLIDEAKDADAMILANMPMSADVLRACPDLKFIDIAFTGVDHVGLEAAKEKGIAVSNASGYSNEAVSKGDQPRQAVSEVLYNNTDIHDLSVCREPVLSRRASSPSWKSCTGQAEA